jgi:ketosteroid isomerase-like protein
MKRRKFHSSKFIVFSTLIVIFCFAARSIGSSSCRPDNRTEGTDSVSDDIDKVQEQMKEAFITGDSALFLKCYAPDACVLAPNTPIFCGQRGIGQFFKNVHQAGIRDAEFHPVALFGQTAEYVTQQGAFEVFDADHHSLNKGKVLIIFKRTNEGWRIFRQSLNFDKPIPQTPGSSTR